MPLETSPPWRFTLTPYALRTRAWGGRAEVWCGLRLVVVFACFMYDSEDEVRAKLEGDIYAYVTQHGGEASR